MQRIHLSRRVTHRYVGTWKHLDEWKHVGWATLTPGRRVVEPEDFDDATVWIRWATLPPGQDLDDSVRALEDIMSSHGCSHEWDCCGCPSYTARAIHRRGRRVCIEVRMSRNY